MIQIPAPSDQNMGAKMRHVHRHVLLVIIFNSLLTSGGATWTVKVSWNYSYHTRQTNYRPAAIFADASNGFLYVGGQAIGP